MAASKETFVNNGVEIRHSVEAKGRGLFATRNFKSGETILEEEPLVCCQFSWNSAYGYAACDYCMKPLETAEENAKRLTGNSNLVLSHPDCDPIDKASHAICPNCAVAYCSLDCKDKGWILYHKSLCCHVLGGNPNHPLEKLNEAWKLIHYPPETATIMLLARILAGFIQSPEKEEFKRKLMAMCHRIVNEEDAVAHKLLGKEFESQLEMLRDLAIKALACTETQEFLTPEGFRSLFALIGRNGQGIGTSSFSVWVSRVSELFPDDAMTDKLIDEVYEAMERESGEFLNNEGSALYAVQSAANHSCAPNSVATFPHSNHTLVLVANRDLEEGEEVTISYLDECALTRSCHSRRKILQDNYLFLCKCSRCTEEEGIQLDVTSEDDDVEDDSMEQ